MWTFQTFEEHMTWGQGKALKYVKCVEHKSEVCYASSKGELILVSCRHIPLGCDDCESFWRESARSAVYDVLLRCCFAKLCVVVWMKWDTATIHQTASLRQNAKKDKFQNSKENSRLYWIWNTTHTNPRFIRWWHTHTHNQQPIKTHNNTAPLKRELL